MPSCSAYGCINRPCRKAPGISFHRFPKDDYLRALWILAVRRKNFTPSSSSILCSKHFSEEMFTRNSSHTTLMRLRGDAVPTIFEGYPAYLKTKLNPCESETEEASIVTDTSHLSDDNTLESNPETEGVPIITDTRHLSDDNTFESNPETEGVSIITDTSHLSDNTLESNPKTEGISIITDTSNLSDNNTSESSDTTGNSTNGFNSVFNGVISIINFPIESFAISPELKSAESLNGSNNASAAKTDNDATSNNCNISIQQQLESSRTAAYERRIEELENSLEKERKKVKILQQKTRRYKNKIINLSRLLIREKHCVNKDSIHILNVTALKRNLTRFKH